MPVDDHVVPEFIIDSSEYVREVCWNGHRLNDFDTYFRTKWSDAMDKGYFKYTLDNLETRVIPGKIKYVVQLNVKRATERRKPHQMGSVSQPFNPDLFNFTKIDKQEILFRVKDQTIHRTSNSDSICSNADAEEINRKSDVSCFMIINVAPYEFGTSLLVPDIHSCLPQVLTADAMRFTFKTILSSNHPGLRFGFNSLCAYASVNHLHMHAYYIEHPLYIETCDVDHLAGPIYESSVIPVKAFVFSVSTATRNDGINEQIERVTEKIIKVTDYLREVDVPYNVMVNWGLPLDGSGQNQRNVIRVFVWPRKHQHFVEKYIDAFNGAYVELSGHIPVKTEEWYNKMDADFIERVYEDTALAPEKYAEIRTEVIRIGQM